MSFSHLSASSISMSEARVRRFNHRQLHAACALAFWTLLCSIQRGCSWEMRRKNRFSDSCMWCTSESSSILILLAVSHSNASRQAPTHARLTLNLRFFHRWTYIMRHQAEVSIQNSHYIFLSCFPRRRSNSLNCDESLLVLWYENYFHLNKKKSLPNNFFPRQQEQLEIWEKSYGMNNEFAINVIVGSWSTCKNVAKILRLVSRAHRVVDYWRIEMKLLRNKRVFFSSRLQTRWWCLILQFDDV